MLGGCRAQGVLGDTMTPLELCPKLNAKPALRLFPRGVSPAEC